MLRPRQQRVTRVSQRGPDALGDPSITASRARTVTASWKSELTLAAMIAARRREILEVEQCGSVCTESRSSREHQNQAPAPVLILYRGRLWLLSDRYWPG